jgi:hypothetical protein
LRLRRRHRLEVTETAAATAEEAAVARKAQWAELVE